MINIPVVQKNIYKNDFLPASSSVAKKSLSAVCSASNITIPISKMLLDSFSIEENLCSKESLEFGSCESAIFKVKVANVDDSIKGKEFTLMQGVNNTYTMPFGLFTIDSAEKENDLIFKTLTGYDRMKWFDTEVISWYNGLNLPMNLKAFRISLYAFIGIPYEDVTLVNDDMPVRRNISANSLNGLTVLKAIMQINGCFGHIDRLGSLRHIVLPKVVTDTYTKNHECKNIKYQDYTALAIDKVKITQEDEDAENDAGAIYGTGSNCYTISGNFLTYGLSASELATVAKNVSVNIFDRPYTPVTDSDFHGQPYWEVGDLISDGSKAFYILNRVMSGYQALKDVITAPGSETVSKNTSVNLEITKLNGKSAVLKRTIEEVSSQVSNLETTTGNQATAIEAMQSGITGLEQDLNGVSVDVADVLSDLQAEITRAKGAEANMYTKAQCDTKISQSATSILEQVSGTYATQASVQEVDGKLASYATTSAMNTALELQQNAIMADVAESYATKLSVQNVEGRLTNYTLKSEYNTQVQALSSGISAEVTARKSFETQVISPYVCNTGKKCGSFKCGSGTSVTSQIIKDTNAKIELLDTKFGVELNDNVSQLRGQMELTTARFGVEISNLNTNMSAQIELLENSISLKQNAGELSSSLSLENGTISLLGNRLNWSSTNSSMTNEGILTCVGLIAISAQISGTIATGGITSTGSYGTMTLNSGYAAFIKNSAIGSVSAEATAHTNGSNEGLLTATMLRIIDGTNTTEVHAAYINTPHISTQSASITSLNGGTPVTSENVTSYIQPSSTPSTSGITASLGTSSTYQGTSYLYFSNTYGDINIPTIGWVKARQDSDERLKENFAELDIKDEYMRLETCQYKFKDGVNNDKVHFGFRAQNVAKQFYPNMYDLVEYDDEIVTQGERKYIDQGGVYRLNYDNMHAMHVYMIQSQQKLIEELQNQLMEVMVKIGLTA